MASAPGIACLDQRKPRHSEEQRDQKRKRDQQRRESSCQLHVGTIVTRSPRLSCKRAAALAPATEISTQPVEPAIRNGPSPLYVVAMRLIGGCCREKEANGIRPRSMSVIRLPKRSTATIVP